MAPTKIMARPELESALSPTDTIMKSIETEFMSSFPDIMDEGRPLRKQDIIAKISLLDASLDRCKALAKDVSVDLAALGDDFRSTHECTISQLIGTFDNQEETSVLEGNQLKRCMAAHEAYQPSCKRTNTSTDTYSEHESTTTRLATFSPEALLVSGFSDLLQYLRREGQALRTYMEKPICPGSLSQKHL